MEDLAKAITISLENALGTFTGSSHQLPDLDIFQQILQTLTNLFSSEEFLLGNHITGKLVMDKLNLYAQSLSHLAPEVLEEVTKFQKDDMITTITKLNFLVNCLISALKLDKDDLSCLPEDHERVIALRTIITTVPLEKPELLSKELQTVFNAAFPLKATVSVTNKYKKSLSRNLLTGWLLIYYSIFAKKKAKKQAQKFDAIGDLNGLLMFWNLGDTVLMRKIYSLDFPPIAYTTRIFVPRLSSHILDSVQELNTIDTENQELEASPKGSAYTLTPEASRVGIRILSGFRLPDLNRSKILPQHNCEAMIIEVHGGGLTSLSSYVHQTYTRKWATDLNTPVFSIDYGLAPEHPFPEGLDDVWQAYTWLVRYSYKYFGINPKRVILAGDSAGGNLVNALTIKAITSGFRVPDGVLAMYPELSLDRDYFSKSVLISLEDNMLPFSFFYTAVEKLYTQGKYPCNLPLVSPVFCKEEVLAKFPRIEIMITENDPLSFDSYRFAENLMRAGARVHVTEFPGFVHGAIRLSDKHTVPLFIPFYDHSRDILRSLIDS